MVGRGVLGDIPSIEGIWLVQFGRKSRWYYNRDFEVQEGSNRSGTTVTIVACETWRRNGWGGEVLGDVHGHAIGHPVKV